MWTYNTNYLSHHGVKGQKWGVRKYQNEDGSYTVEGKIHYKDTKEKQRARKIAAIGGGIVAAKSIKDFIKNLMVANTAGDMIGIGHVPVKEAITKTAIAAGKYAALGAIATYGAVRAVDFIKDSKNKKASSSAGFVGNTPSPKESIRKSQSIGTINAPTVSESLRQHRKYNI